MKLSFDLWSFFDDCNFTQILGLRLRQYFKHLNNPKVHCSFTVYIKNDDIYQFDGS